MRLLLLNFVIATANAQTTTGSWYSMIDPDRYPNRHNQYLYSICAPNTSVAVDLRPNTGDSRRRTVNYHGITIPLPNTDYPCGAALAVSDACRYTNAEELLQLYRGNLEVNDQDRLTPPSSQAGPAEQRACICNSEFFDQLHACGSCLSKHGSGTIPLAYMNAGALKGLRAKYCNPGSELETPFNKWWKEWTVGKHAPEEMKSGLSAASTSGFSDQLGTAKTELSRYYVPHVTGAAALRISDSTNTAAGGHTVTETQTATNGAGNKPDTIHMLTELDSATEPTVLRSVNNGRETTRTTPERGDAKKTTAANAAPSGNIIGSEQAGSQATTATNRGKMALKMSASVERSSSTSSFAASVSPIASSSSAVHGDHTTHNAKSKAKGMLLSSSVSAPASSSIAPSSSAVYASSSSLDPKYKNGTRATGNHTLGSHASATMSVSADSVAQKTLCARFAGILGVAAAFAML